MVTWWWIWTQNNYPKIYALDINYLMMELDAQPPFQRFSPRDTGGHSIV